jgi:hypothetical protein
MGGVSPADVTSLILHLELDKRQRAAAQKRAEGRQDGDQDAQVEDGELAQA